MIELSHTFIDQVHALDHDADTETRIHPSNMTAILKALGRADLAPIIGELLSTAARLRVSWRGVVATLLEECEANGRELDVLDGMLVALPLDEHGRKMHRFTLALKRQLDPKLADISARLQSGPAPGVVQRYREQLIDIVKALMIEHDLERDASERHSLQLVPNDGGGWAVSWQWLRDQLQPVDTSGMEAAMDAAATIPMEES